MSLKTEKSLFLLMIQNIPWRSPFCPTNILTKQPYKGFNRLLLNDCKWWGTFEQWQSLNSYVIVTSSAKIISYKSKNNSTINQAVYSLDQVVGCKDTVENKKAEWFVADKLIENSRAKINFVYGEMAAYNYPPEDCIVFPLKSQFYGQGGLPGYYDSLFHELAHWSEIRLDWSPDSKWDEETRYAINELRAEMTAGWLMTNLNLPSSKMNKNHNAYMKCWLVAIDKDKELISKVALAASQTVDFLQKFIRC